MKPHDKPALESVGQNPTLLWGLTTTERTRRIAASEQFGNSKEFGLVLVNAQYVADPSWIRHVAANPGLILSIGGVPSLGHARDETEAEKIREAMLAGSTVGSASDLRVIAYEDGPTIENKQLRKRETPFLMRLTQDSVREIERASYFGAYKGVTDVLTKYLWPELAFVLTRIAARLGMTPNAVTAIGAIFCIAATFAFAWGYYWSGMAMGFVFMVLDTVDGKLARCTITSSWWGNIFDHGIDLVHPPFWWWFWATGLIHWGLALDETTFWWVQGAIQGGYVLQRLIEGIFMRRNGKMHIHVWRRFDSWFRLITARRNPNMVILFVATLFGRPDIGIIAVAIWTVVSLVVHVIQLIQAEIARAKKGSHLTSWLAEEGA